MGVGEWEGRPRGKSVCVCVCYHSVVSDSIRINVADAFRCAAETNLNL